MSTHPDPGAGIIMSRFWRDGPKWSLPCNGGSRRTYGSEMTEKPDRPTLDALARQLADSVPGNLKSMGEDMERNFKSLLQSALARMDLVTREEFDVQTAVLARTREKLEALEARLDELENHASD